MKFRIHFIKSNKKIMNVRSLPILVLHSDGTGRARVVCWEWWFPWRWPRKIAACPPPRPQHQSGWGGITLSCHTASTLSHSSTLLFWLSSSAILSPKCDAECTLNISFYLGQFIIISIALKLFQATLRCSFTTAVNPNSDFPDYSPRVEYQGKTFYVSLNWS